MLPSSTLRRRLLLGLAGLVAVATAGTAVLLADRPQHAANRPDRSPAGAVATRTPAVLPVLHVAGLVAGRLSWAAPLTVTVSSGTLRSVRATDERGGPLAGRLGPAGWRATSPLVPATAYRLDAVAVDSAGRAHDLPAALSTTPPVHVVHARSQPGNGAVVGVGLPVIVMLDRQVTLPADRAALQRRLSVASTPAVPGAWRWFSPTELHYRGPAYWASGTRLVVRTDLTGLPLSGGTWGSGSRTVSYRVGPSMISTVDVTAHVMRVVRDGRLLRTVNVSTGRDKYPTKGGVHMVVEKTALQVMDSATVGIPRNSPDGYFEKVPYSVRISYGGAFVHSADWSLRDQGVRNVSHGCVNLSPADAQWFFGLTRRGDIVDVVHSTVPPLLSDPGTADWNIPFAQWAG